jgi:hypothetical protein
MQDAKLLLCAGCNIIYYTITCIILNKAMLKTMAARGSGWSFSGQPLLE